MNIKTQSVPVLTQRLARTSLGVLVSLGVAACVFPQATLAQLGQVQPSGNLQDEPVADPFSGRNDGGGLGVFDLIHRAQLGNLRSLEDYSTEQRQNLNDATADFKRQQMERLRKLNQVQSVPIQPVIPPVAK